MPRALITSFLLIAVACRGSTAPGTFSDQALRVLAISPVSVVGTAGATVRQRPKVLVTSASGERAAGVPVKFRIQDGAGEVIGGEVFTDSAGIARVESWTLGRVAGHNELSAEIISGRRALTFNAIGLPGEPSRLAFLNQPNASFASLPLPSAIRVAVLDANGNLVDTATDAITLSTSAEAASPLSGVTTASARGGIATFQDVSILKARDGVVLRATASGRAQAVSAPIANLTARTLTITSGGTYTGNWGSADPLVTAIRVLTKDPVVIENCTIIGRGNLIRAEVSNAHITVRNCRGFGLDPMVKGRTRGDFLYANKPGSITAEHNSFEGVSFGINLHAADGWLADGPIRIRYNKARNLDGVPSDGAGGRDISHLNHVQDNGNHFVILANLQRLQGAEIAWNDVTNEPGISSISDVINIYKSSGTAESPILIHNNYIRGGYPADLNAIVGYSAGGIITDGSASDNAKTATAFVKIFLNQVVNQSNCGVCIDAGHDVEAYQNRTISTGRLPNGQWTMQTFGNGIVLWNCSCHKQSPKVFFNNVAHDNVSGWIRQDADSLQRTNRSGVPVRRDYYMPDCAVSPLNGSSMCVGNDKLPEVTESGEKAELVRWQQKLGATRAQIGPPP